MTSPEKTWDYLIVISTPRRFWQHLLVKADMLRRHISTPGEKGRLHQYELGFSCWSFLFAVWGRFIVRFSSSTLRATRYYVPIALWASCKYVRTYTGILDKRPPWTKVSWSTHWLLDDNECWYVLVQNRATLFRVDIHLPTVDFSTCTRSIFVALSVDFPLKGVQRTTYTFSTFYFRRLWVAGHT